MKPLFLLPDLGGGGAEAVTLNLVGQLATEGCDARVRLLRDAPVKASLPPNLAVNGREVRASASGGGRREARGLFAAARASDVIVGALELRTYLVAVALGAVCRRPVVLWLHKDLDTFLARKRASIRWLYLTLLRAAVARCDRLVAVSDGVAEGMWRIAPAHADKICRLYNALRIDAIDAAIATATAKPAWWPEDRYVLAVGRLTWQKGFDVLIDAFARVVRQDAAVQLVILGEGELRDTLQQRVRALGLEGRVQLPGYHPPYQAMTHASVFAMSSRFEGLSMVLLEALYCGARVVATDCPSGPSEVVGRGRFGTLVPPGNAEALANAIVAALTRPVGGEEAERQREHVRGFAPARIVPTWHRLLRDVAAGRRPSRANMPERSA
ncbi:MULTISPECIES: glycosyltransferase [unclassified Cupriavidus]|uniref:glycosyltransferase n=1 Tax=unclassified Cupriavidus TaxID=2640874 RepID=UPI00313C521A